MPRLDDIFWPSCHHTWGHMNLSIPLPLLHPRLPLPLEISREEMPGQVARLASCGSNRALDKYAHSVCQQDAASHVLLRIWKVTGKSALNAQVWTLPAPPSWQSDPGPRGSAGNDLGKSLLVDAEGLSLNLFLVTGHKMLAAFWDPLSQHLGHSGVPLCHVRWSLLPRGTTLRQSLQFCLSHLPSLVERVRTQNICGKREPGKLCASYTCIPWQWPGKILTLNRFNERGARSTR